MSALSQRNVLFVSPALCVRLVGEAQVTSPGKVVSAYRLSGHSLGRVVSKKLGRSKLRAYFEQAFGVGSSGGQRIMDNSQKM